MKDVRDAGDAQVTQAAKLPHTSDFLFSDIPLIKGSCSVSYIALLCMDVLREVHSSSLSTSRGDNEVIYNPLQLQRTWRMALPSLCVCRAVLFVPWEPLCCGERHRWDPCSQAGKRWLLPLHPHPCPRSAGDWGCVYRATDALTTRPSKWRLRVWSI